MPLFSVLSRNAPRDRTIIAVLFLAFFYHN